MFPHLETGLTAVDWNRVKPSLPACPPDSSSPASTYTWAWSSRKGSPSHTVLLLLAFKILLQGQILAVALS